MSPTSTRLETLPALPSPQLVDAKADPAAAIVSLVEPATAWLAQATDISEISDLRAKAAALETYARARDLSVEAIRSAQVLQLRSVGAMGRLLPAHPPGRGNKSPGPREISITTQDASRFRAIAENVELVEQAIADGDVEKLSMNRVLGRIERERRQHVDETARTITPAKGSKAKYGERWSMIRGDMAKELAKMPAASVDAIVTDPPYPTESLPLWSTLAEQAARVLVPDGLLIALTGQILLLDVAKRLDEHLTYGWTYCQPLPGAQSRIRGRHIYQCWKPWLVFTTGTWPSGRIDWHRDALDVVPVEKDDYRWQQTVRPAEQLISSLVPTNGLVLDPFAGAGTYGIAALAAGCRFVGVEADAERFATAVGRLEQAP